MTRRRFGHVLPRTAAAALAVLLAAPALAAGPAGDAPAAASAANPAPVRVRIGEHPNFTRVVFDWPRLIDYRVDRGEDDAEIQFAAAGTLDLAVLGQRRFRLLLGIAEERDGDRLDATLRTTAGVRLRHFRDGTKIVVDLLAPAASAAPGSAGIAPEAPPRASGSSGQGAAGESGRSLAPAAEAPAGRAGSAEAPPPPSRGRGEATAKTPPLPSEPPPATANRPAVTSAALSAPTVQTPVPPAEPRTVRSASRLMVVQEPVGPGVRLGFRWPVPVAAAVFQRAGNLWIVFDRPIEVDVSGLLGGDAVLQAEQLADAAATVLRLRIRPDLAPVIGRAEATWLVDLQPRSAAAAAAAIEVRAEPSAAAGARVFLPVVDTGLRLAVDDSEVGDRLDVVTLQAPGAGLNLPRDFAQFSLLPSAQGVVVQAKSDAVIVQSLRNGVEITAREGLLLSGAPLPGYAGQLAGPGLFRFAEWRGPDGEYAATKQMLLRRIAEAAPEGRSLGRLDLARFYFAQDMASDAIGVLSQLARLDPQAAEDRGFRALRGAVNFDLGRLSSAEADFAHVDLADNAEAALWRGAVLAAGKDWAEARAQLDRGAGVIDSYPPERRARFRLAGAAARFGTGDTEGALHLLDGLAREPLRPDLVAEAALLRGRVQRQRRDNPAALAAYRAAADSGHRQTRAWAELERVEVELASERIGPAQAAERLEALRHAWRGDGFELALLRQLGQAQMDSGDFRGGLATWRQAVTQYPNAAEAKQTTQQMAAVFSRLFIDGEADRLPAVEALGLYYDFRELTPLGSRGDEMIRKLADRLVSVDLLARAAELIEHQVNFRLRGEERAKVATQLAIIHLLDHKPEAALKALQGSEWSPMPAPLAAERRHLEARALADLAQSEAALQLLAGDASSDAERLRAEIAWRGKDWPAAVRSLQGLLGERHADPAPLGDGERQRVLQIAVAMALAGDSAGLDRLRTQYVGRLDGSSEADAFRVVTGRVKPGDTEFRMLASSIAGVAQLEAFMAGYREKLQKLSLSAIN